MGFNLQNLEQQVVTKALKDPQFKQKLIVDPKGAIESIIKDQLGSAAFSLPANVKIKVVEDTQDTYYLKLPYFDPTLPTDQNVGCW